VSTLADGAIPSRHRENRLLVLGLTENWRQFSLLVLVNAFVGAMVGLERTVLPLIASADFGIASRSAALSFIVAFGITKALTNLAAGWLVGRRGRRWTLIAGWLVAVPVPLVILHAPTWSWIVFANVLLGINQGLAWSATVIMKIDLAGPRRRGLAMGLNEAAGYLAVALAALASGFIASGWGLRAGPSYLGLVIVLAGLLVSVFLVRDTAGHARLEETHMAPSSADAGTTTIRSLLARSTWSDATLFSVSQAGFVNNLNDGLAWGLFPLLFVSSGLSLQATSVLAAIYPAVWGLSQLWTGGLSDRLGRKRLIVTGMLVQAVALVAMTVWQGFRPWAAALVALGLGTALVYPTLLAAVGDSYRPSSRAAAVGVYRLWRDLGYAAGALLAGVLADAIGMLGTIEVIGALTAASGLLVAVRLHERPDPQRNPAAQPPPVTTPP
jgi:predicted MFS family arabinose efflux permease